MGIHESDCVAPDSESNARRPSIHAPYLQRDRLTAAESRRAIRSVITSWGWLTGTPEEDRAAYALCRLGCRPGPFTQQLRVGRYRLDIAAEGVGIDLEVDGWHHFSPEHAARDAERDAVLRAAGWLVIRVDYRLDDDQLVNVLLPVVQLARWGTSRAERNQVIGTGGRNR